MFVTKFDREFKRKVSDPELNEDFQEALKCDPTLMIEETPKIVRRGFFKKKTIETYYNVYHETPAWDGTPYQARYQFSASGSKNIVKAYLHGIYNGVTHLTNKPK